MFLARCVCRHGTHRRICPRWQTRQLLVHWPYHREIRHVHVPVSICHCTFPIAFTVAEFADVFVPVGMGESPFSSSFAINEFANVFVPAGKHVGALSIELTVAEFANKTCRSQCSYSSSAAPCVGTPAGFPFVLPGEKTTGQRTRRQATRRGVLRCASSLLAIFPQTNFGCKGAISSPSTKQDEGGYVALRWRRASAASRASYKTLSISEITGHCSAAANSRTFSSVIS
jgi:hypothetical protein